MAEEMHLEMWVTGHRVVRRKLGTIAKRARKSRQFFLEAYARFRELESIHFGREGGASGPWTPLRPNTVARKARAGEDSRILHATLMLRMSLTKRGAKYGVFRTSGDTAVFGTSHPAAKFHQSGTEKMAQRKPIDLSDGDKREIVQTIQEFLLRGASAGSIEGVGELLGL